MENITKSFGGVHALNNVSFKVKLGQIHALVGENGAGKSTLVKILAGACQKDQGNIKINSHMVNPTSPHVGRKLGIAIIYQEFALVPDLTVAENILLDHLSTKAGLMNWRKLYRKAAELINRIGFDIDPRAIAGRLSVASQQVVEIAKALSENARILILDEPTAVLAPRDVERLFEVLEKLKQQGTSIIYISHRLDEVFRIADRITVLKDGIVTGSFLPNEVTSDEIINLMIGRNLTTMFDRHEKKLGDEILRIIDLSKGRKVQNVSFSVRAGEILGLAGLVGSGRTETVRAIFGADEKTSGTIVLNGKTLKINSPADAVKAGIGLLPEDRKLQGAILSMSVRENVTMPGLQKAIAGIDIINETNEKKMTKKLIEKLAIKADTETSVEDLSGGNQQKVVLAKWFATNCKVLIMDEPTRGVDVGAKTEIYKLINTLAQQGLGIIVICSEMNELIGLCDSVVVFKDGRAQAVLNDKDISEENIMKLAIGEKETRQEFS
ncbi:MAG: sugar ABC transporter ATP-binding protein [Planctomycetota bacterium]|jgi:ribose transport system ATP-binding protein